MFYSCRILLILSCFVLTLCSYAQQEAYHRVEIQLSQEKDIHTLQQLGLPLDCGGELHEHEKNRKTAMFYIAELSDSELDLVKKAGFKTKVLQADVAAFYAKRIAADPVKSVADFRKMKNANWGLGKDEPFYEIPEHFEMGSMGGYLTYEELLFHLDQMHELYPNLVSAKTPINSELLTYENRPLYWLKISDFPYLDESQEPEVLYTALHHAREPISVMQLIYFMYYLLENYDSDSEIQDLVNSRELYFVPCINPDGYVYNQFINPEGGGLWRKNRKVHEDGNVGVDLNRNYGYEWGYSDTGSSPNTFSNTYRGEAPFSEPETQLMKEFCEAHDFKIALNYHAYGNYLIYPWGYALSTYTEDHDYFQQMCHRSGWHNNYIYGTVHEALTYTANGDSDDWMYGEQTTKNKIFAITPEVGESTDNFWPMPSRIIPLCQENVWANLQYAYMAGKYAVATDASEKNIQDLEGTLKVKLQRMGLEVDGTFTLQIQPISSNFTNTSAPFNSSNLDLLATETFAFDYVLSADIQDEETIQYVILVNNGDFTLSTDTITKWYNAPVEFEDPAENLTEWYSEDWYRTNQTAYSGDYSLTDSPYTDYQNFDSTTIVLQQAIDLSNALETKLSFWAKWDIQPHRDFAQVLASKDNGETWTALCGNFTQVGTRYQAENEPIYDGKQMEWVREEMDLSDFAGESVLICFLLQSNGNTKADGFYFDDFKVSYRTSLVADLKLVLEGAYNANTGEMNTYLRAKNLLPISQPFNEFPWQYEGTESISDLTSMPSNVVDWILVELRSEIDTSLAAQKAAWLLSDGSVMDVLGRTGVLFENVAPNEPYFLLVRHRNHLDVLSSSAITLPNTYDFTLSSNQAAGSGQLAEVSENVYALKAGDVDGNGIVSIPDFNAYQVQQSFLNEYVESDLSMDGLVSVKDYNAYRLRASELGIPIVRYE